MQVWNRLQFPTQLSICREGFHVTNVQLKIQQVNFCPQQLHILSQLLQ